jgi:GNAT superfamily N-acetyltransferase
MDGFEIKALDSGTWEDFAGIAERHNGVWGGCWCMSFHVDGGFGKRTAAENRADKETLVRDGRAHAALVYDAATTVGWCQFGPTPELPRIKHRREYLAGLASPGGSGPGGLPDWRITCFFVDREWRHRGVAAAALAGALSEIARLGGGTVEGYPEDAEGRKVSGSFLWSGTLAMFEREGFTRSRRLGKHHWVATKTVPGSRPAS